MENKDYDVELNLKIAKAFGEKDVYVSEKCGHVNAGENKFCGECGCRLKSDVL
ncbi:hypothetical protein AGMMS49975_23510 [Clostridia bacterium]|nr:hypothetical protein AGMMS49975_23510 [Clostridia bacterium]